MSCDEKLSGAEFYPGNLSQEVGLKTDIGCEW